MRLKNLILIATLFLTMFSFTLDAQNVTVNPGAGMYPTLKDAFDAINAGTHTGAVVVTITGNTTETASAVLNASGTGSANYTSVSITPTGGVSRTISGSIAAPLIDLNGADNVTIDGLNTGGNSLTIDNQSTGIEPTSTIRFIGDAESNTLQNTTILGASAAIATGTIFFSTSAGGSGNDNNLITSSTIDASSTGSPANGIFSSGTVTVGQENSGNTISNSNIANFFSATLVSMGILVDDGSTEWDITGNRLYQSVLRTYTTANTHKAINVSSGNGHTVNSNLIGSSNASGTGVYSMTGTIAVRFIAIDLAVGTTTATSVQGNQIFSISLGTSSGVGTTNGILCGINVTSGDVNIGTITGNIIGATTGIASLIATPTSTGGALVGINSSTTGNIAIQNNMIGAFQCIGSAPTIGSAVYGINRSGVAASVTITNNTLGNSTADNMQAGTLGTTTAATIAMGINMTSVASSTISDNTIQNFSSFGSGTGNVRGIFTSTTSSTTATYTITNNSISNLKTNSSLAGATSGLTAAAGIHYFPGINSIISGNTIWNIHGLNTGLVGTVITGIAAAQSTNATFSNNRIYDISNFSTATSLTAPGVAAGITIRSGTTEITIVNNMISLGSFQVSNTSFIGIYANHGSTPNPLDKIYFNTVNITGVASSGAQPSFGFFRGDFTATARVAPVDIRNNIFTNDRSGGTGSHFAIANNYGATVSATGWGMNASDYNVLNAAPSTVGWWGGNQTFAGWKTASNGDSHSFSGISVIYADPGSDLHLNMGLTPTVIESGATPIAGITTDYDNQIRPGPAGSVNGGAIFPDIGADEFDGVPLDLLPPNITYTPLSNSICTNSYSLSVTIEDITAVDTNSGTRPRVWFKKSTENNVLPATNTSASNGWKYVEASNTSSPFSFTIDYSLLSSPVMAGDVIQYFVVAQDILMPPNVGTNAATYPMGFTPASVALEAGAFPVSGVNSFTILANPVSIMTVVSPDEVCISDDVELSLSGDSATGAEYQWQSSPTGTNTWTDIAGATTVPYTVVGVSASTDYRAIISCGGVPISASPSILATVTVTSTMVLTTTPGSECGPGPVSVALGATSTPGSTLEWYDVPTGGTVLGTGTTFNTPPITMTTTYYVSASEGGGSASVGLPAALPTATSGAGTTNFGLVFDVFAPFTLNTVDVYAIHSTAGTPGTVTIDVVDGTGAVLHTQTVNVTGNPVGSAVAETVTLNFNIVPGTNLKLRPGARTGVTGLLFEPSAAAPAGNYGYPFTVPGILSITASTLTAPPTNTPRLDLYYYFYNWQISYGCTTPRVPVVATIINDPPVCPANFSVCIDDPAFVLTGATPTDGVYSGNGVSNGMFDPSLAGAGTHTITYTQCSLTCTFDITVNALPIMTCPANLTVCVDTPPFPLTGGTPAGGTYSGSGVSNGIFDPAIPGAGSYTITYEVTDGNGCSNSCTFTIVVASPPVVTCPADITVCTDTPPFVLTEGSPGGGTFSGPGVSGGMFDPPAAGLGMHTITYTATDGNGCTNTCVFIITVTTPPTVTITATPNDTVCAPGTITLDAGAGYINYMWSNGGMSQTIVVNASNTYGVTVTDGNGCTGFNSATVVVNSGPPLSESHVDPTDCFSNDGSIDLMVLEMGSFSYNWTSNNGIGLINGQEDQMGLSAGTYNVTVTNTTTGCASTLSIQLIVFGGCGGCEPVDTVIVSPDTICSGGSATFTAVGTIPGATFAWFDAPIGGNQVGTGNPFVSGPLTTDTAFCVEQTIMVPNDVTLEFTGDNQIFVVPAGVTSISISMHGAQGGGSGSNATGGGLGGTASGNLAVVPGQMLNVFVGGQGGPGLDGGIGGFNGGGIGGQSQTGGGGGGASDIRVGGIALGNRVIVAGGGGGAGGHLVGGLTGGLGGGTTGGNGAPIGAGTGAAGGTQATGGAGGFGGGGADGLSGGLGIGGGGGNAAKAAGGGGGGGGYYGGGGGEAGGSSGGSGAGGSGYTGGVTAGSTSQGFQSGNGQVVITYLVPCTSERVCASVNFIPSTPPTISCPMDITVSCTSEVPVPNPASVSATDNQGGVPTVTFVADATINPTCANRLTVIRTYRATDECGNSSTCNQTITVNDVTPPTITCPTDVTVSCASDVTPPVTQLPTADNCGGGIPTISWVGDVTISSTCANRFTALRTYRATDVCGNSATCTQTITVNDVTPPMITCPGNITVSCANNVPPPATNLPATDNCGGGTPTVTWVNDVTISLQCANRFTAIRTFRATDVCGNSATCTQTIVVNDVTPPMLTCPTNVTVTCASQVPAPSPPPATDNCGGALPTVVFVSDVTTSFTCVNRFTAVRTYRATDVCGNSATCTQTITVFDNVAPMITCPANVTVQCANLVPPVNLNLPTTDNCGGPVPTITLVSNITTNQTCLNRFTLTRTYRATDACGNSATCAQIITVNDITPPTITLVHPLLTGIPNNGTLEVQCFGQDPNWDPPVFNAASATAVDNCTGAVTLGYSETLVDGGDCENDGFINRYRLVWTATDACGNSSSRTAFVNLVDEIPPVITGVPENITVNCDEIPPVPENIMATDECLCACIIEFNQTVPLPGCQDGQVIVRSWTAVDDCGNETIETQNITLVDDEGPVLQIMHPDLIGTTNGTIFEYSCKDGIPGFFDDLNAESVMSLPSCGGTTMIKFTSNTIEARNCEFFGFIEQRTYQWVAVDQCGNVSIFTIVAQVVDDEPPVLVGVPDMACIGDPALEDIDVEDNCDQGVFIYYEVTIPNPCGTGNAIRRVYQAFDPCGNVAEDTVVLIPNDNNSPSMIFINPALADLEPGETLIVECKTNFGTEDVSIDDDCPDTEIIFDQVITSTGDCSTNGILSSMILTWTATDMCGNSTQLTAEVIVMDRTAPVFSNSNAVITIGCNDPVPESIATDNCGEVEVAVLENIVPGNCSYEYQIFRVATATDPCGNETTLLQVINVGDGSGPIIEGVEDVLCDDLEIPEVTAWDPCAEEYVDVTMTEEVLNIPCRDGIVIQRTWTATDICGNVSVATQTFIVDDHTPPVILIPSHSIILQFVDNPTTNLVFLSQTSIMDRLNDLEEGTVTVYDDCGEELIPVFTVDITFADDCEEDGYFERRTYSWVVSDVCGNEASLSFTVDIMDDLGPVLSGVPADEIIICQELPAAPVIQVEDPAQPVTLEYSELIVNGGNPGEFIVTRTWTATDACGNSASASQKITWIPDTFLECEIELPGLVDCNTHNVFVTSAVTGGLGELTYKWEIEGEKCFIQDGQGTSAISIYVGFSQVEITLTVTDEFGCITICTATLDCLDPLDDQLTQIPVTHTPGQYNGESYTPVEVISSAPKDNLQQLNLWPNPANESLHLSFESQKPEVVEFSFMNFLGQIVLVEKTIAQKGFNSQKIDVSGMVEGGYLLQITTENEMHTKVIMVIRNN